MTPLRATVRLQLHAGFDLDAAAAQVPYFARLGVSHVYLSPITAAVPGSMHGYDVVDPTRVNPELGGEAALERLVAALHRHGMGLVLDIVPNHMAAHETNRWWWDVLRNGRGGRHARFFDIDWNAAGAEGKLVLPVLDRPAAQAVADGLLQVAPDEAGGEPLLQAPGQRFPLRLADDAPRDPEALRAWATHCNARRDALMHLLDAQAYRLVWWRLGNDRINYRRFFDITSLAALRVERREVFDAVHALPLELIARGWVDGLRVDHVDGLASPRRYCHRLRRAVDDAAARAGRAPGEVPVYVEKILAAGERLRRDWRVHGTTGYEFMDQVAAVLHAPEGEAPLRALWRRHSGRSGDFRAEERAARAQVLDGALHAERERTVDALLAVARHDPVAREFSRHLWTRALSAGLSHFGVYRTYARDRGLDAPDAAVFRRAWDAARGEADPAVVAALDAIERWMREDARAASPSRRRLLRVLRRRIEQLAAPLNAKAVEDTAFYRHGVLLSRNEVGADPTRFALDPHGFHRACRARARRFPRALLATATHDHKRGEDVRARLAVLSERAPWWAECIDGWTGQARALRERADAPSPGDELMLYQTVVGAWPLDLQPDDGAGLRDYAERIVAWQRKAIREAKLRTTWTVTDDDYESACEAFSRRLLCASEGRALRTALCRAAERIALPGALNGLVQCTLRLTTPGVPDLYQGTEGWDLSLVDPDNRRPVDYAARAAWQAAEGALPALLRDWRSGALKFHLIARLLDLRRRRPALFACGDHRALAAVPAGAPVLAFARRHRDARVVVAVPRLVSHALDGADVPLLPATAWQGARLRVPGGRYRDAMTGERVVVDAAVPLEALLAHAPVAVLIEDDAA